MRIVKFLVTGVAALVAVGLAATPAMAQGEADTVTTFEVTAGVLGIAAPASADLLTGVGGVDITGSLGTVTVTDLRASDEASWAAAVTATDFTTGGSTAGDTILASEIGYWSGALTATTGNGTFDAAQDAVGDQAALSNATPLPAFTHTGGTGNNTLSWAPSLNINTPLDSVAGDYTGTVTHSVA